MIEQKTERVHPGQVDLVTEIYTGFGWTLTYSDEVYDENTEIVGVDVKAYGDGIVGSFMKGFTGNDGTINVRRRRNITNYAVLTFSRDTGMANYEELKELERQYYGYLDCADEPRKPVKRTVISAILWGLIIVSVIMAIFDTSIKAELWEIIVCVAVPLVTLPLVILSWVNYKKKYAAYENCIAVLSDILNQAYEISNTVDSHI